MSAPVLAKEQRERLGRWPQDNPSLCQDIVAAIAAIDALEAELEKERLRLAACGVAASSNTPATVADRIGLGHPYYSASYSDVCRAVDREMALRAERDALAAKVAELEGKALAFDDTHRGDFESRARALAETMPASWGRNIWHLVVELAEQRGAKVAALAEALGDAKHALYRVGMGGDPMDAMTACKAAASVLAAHDASGALNG